MAQRSVYEVTTDKGTYEVEVEEAPHRDALDTATGLLPTAGGILGGLVGGAAGLFGGGPIGAGAGATIGATIGGAGGKGFQTAIEAYRHGPSSSTLQDLKGVGEQGALQGALELGGRAVINPLIQPLLRSVGTALTKLSLNAPQVLKEFPDVARTMIRERLPVGKVPFRPAGSVQAGTARAASAEATDQALQEATYAGMTIPPKPLLGTSIQRVQEAAAAPVGGPTQIQLKNLMRQFGEEHMTQPIVTQVPSSHQIATGVVDAYGNPVMKTITKLTPKTIIAQRPPLTPIQAKSMKVLAQRESDPIYAAERAGQYVPKASQVRAQFNRDIGGNLKGALESLPGGFGERIGTSEARTQSLIGAQRAIRETEQRRFALNPFEARNVAAAGLGGLGAYSSGRYDPQSLLEQILLSRAALSPRVLSRLGLGVTHPILGPLLLRAGRSLSAPPE